MIAKVSQETLAADDRHDPGSRINFFMNKFRKLGLIDYNGDIRVHPSLLNAVLHEKPGIELGMNLAGTETGPDSGEPGYAQVVHPFLVRAIRSVPYAFHIAANRPCRSFQTGAITRHRNPRPAGPPMSEDFYRIKRLPPMSSPR